MAELGYVPQGDMWQSMHAGVGGGTVVHTGICGGDGLVCDAAHPQDPGIAGKDIPQPAQHF